MMMTLRTLPAMVLGLLVLFGGPGRAWAQTQYVIKTIDAPDELEVKALLANGNTPHKIVGEFDDANGTHGFVRSEGSFKQFDVPGADGYTSLNGINAKGDRAGIYFAHGRYFGYFWHNGNFKKLNPPDCNFSVAEFLNARGQVVGFSRKDLEPRHAFIWQDGVFTTIDEPDAGPRGTRLYGINDLGQVVGAYANAENILRGFLLSEGHYTEFDAPGSEDGGYTIAQGINNDGQIAGFYSDANGKSHGFVLTDGVYSPVEVTDAKWTEVYSINANGEVVGAYEDETGIHGFKGTPVQE
jgi:probable HAF family extracellular repeat protein